MDGAQGAVAPSRSRVWRYRPVAWQIGRRFTFVRSNPGRPQLRLESNLVPNFRERTDSAELLPHSPVEPVVEHLFELSAVHPDVLVKRDEATDFVGELLGGGDVLFGIPILASLDGGGNSVGAEVDDMSQRLPGCSCRGLG